MLEATRRPEHRARNEGDALSIARREQRCDRSTGRQRQPEEVAASGRRYRQPPRRTTAGQGKKEFGAEWYTLGANGSKLEKPGS